MSESDMNVPFTEVVFPCEVLISMVVSTTAAACTIGTLLGMMGAA
jgi:hypothetical protein